MTTTEPAITLRGRPRDEGIDLRVLDTTRALLTSEGYDGTTISAVARRSGVSASAIYRRWPSRITLIEEAVFPGFDEVTLTPTGDIRQDLRRFIYAYREVFAHPAARAALPGLLAVYQSRRSGDPGAESFAPNMRPYFHQVMAAARPGTVDPSVDPDDLLDVLVGAVIYKALWEPITPRAGAPDHTADLLDRIIRPAP